MALLEDLKYISYRWEFVLSAAVLYTVAVKLANRSRPRPAAAFTRTTTFKWICVLHNTILAAYSAWTFVNSVPIMHKRFSNDQIPIIKRICCANRQIFDDGMDRLVYLFYLSKFYEVIDTGIILAKGKKSPLLQTYHHAGAMLCVFAGSKYKAVPIWLFVVFNSFIHSIMYVYYVFAALKLPFPRTLKKSLTTMQISQFLIGGSSAVAYFFMKPEDMTSCLPDTSSKYATMLTVAYLTPLTGLFVKFFVNEYRKPKPVKAAVQRASNAVNSSLKSRA